jgi:hypothetical protein
MGKNKKKKNSGASNGLPIPLTTYTRVKKRMYTHIPEECVASGKIVSDPSAFYKSSRTSCALDALDDATVR